MTNPTTPPPASAANLEQRFFQRLNRIVEPIVRTGVGNSVAGPGAFVVQTTGRRSGLPRRVPLLADRFGDTIIVTTFRRRSQWIRNLERHPSALVWVGGQRRRAIATVIRLPGAIVALLQLQN